MPTASAFFRAAHTRRATYKYCMGCSLPACLRVDDLLVASGRLWSPLVAWLNGQARLSEVDVFHAALQHGDARGGHAAMARASRHGSAGSECTLGAGEDVPGRPLLPEL